MGYLEERDTAGLLVCDSWHFWSHLPQVTVLKLHQAVDVVKLSRGVRLPQPHRKAFYGYTFEYWSISSIYRIYKLYCCISFDNRGVEDEEA